MQNVISITPYNSEWPNQFLELKNFIWPEISDFALSIEHVGSTSVTGLMAKPVIDIDIVISNISFIKLAVQRLEAIGYQHRGDMGIEGRHAFKSKDMHIKHNLYVCPQDNMALKNHLCLRDTLRSNSELRDQYSLLKQELALKFPNSIDEYVEGKTEFIISILNQYEFETERLEEIRKMNQAPRK